MHHGILRGASAVASGLARAHGCSLRGRDEAVSTTPAGSIPFLKLRHNPVGPTAQALDAARWSALAKPGAADTGLLACSRMRRHFCNLNRNFDPALVHDVVQFGGPLVSMFKRIADVAGRRTEYPRGRLLDSETVAIHFDAAARLGDLDPLAMRAHDQRIFSRWPGAASNRTFVEDWAVSCATPLPVHSRCSTSRDGPLSLQPVPTELFHL